MCKVFASSAFVFGLVATAAAGTTVLGAPSSVPPPGSAVGRIADPNAPWVYPARPKEGTPNVIFVVFDDVGFGQFGCFGSPLQTPNIDRLAATGLRYSNFHVNPVCSPSRAALLTGRNAHAVGVATVADLSNGYPNNQGGIATNAVTLPAMLDAAGFTTLAVGKWHLTPMTEQNFAASSTHWPTGSGFSRFYGYLGGDTNQFAPDLFQDRHRIQAPSKNADGSPYFLDADLTDHAINFISDQQAADPRRPFFLHLAYCAGHAPHHAPPEFLARWRGRFDQGWDVVRQETFERQKQMGLIARDAVLPPSMPGVKPWANLSAEERRVYARYYEAFAALLEYSDRQLGRLLDYLDRTGLSSNTLVCLISDNGASPEGGAEGAWNEVQLLHAERPGTLASGQQHYNEIGGPLTYATYPLGWTQAGNTPFRRTKGTVYEGGVHVPLIIRWPARIAEQGAVRSQYCFVTDLAATVLDATGVRAPDTFHSIPQLPLHGASLSYTWSDSSAATRHPTQYYELFGHRAIEDNGWKAVLLHARGTPWDGDRWELYNVRKDPTESRDLASQEPQKLTALLNLWEQEAAKYNVYPLDDRAGGRETSHWPGDPALRGSFTYWPPLAGIHKGTAPELRGRSFRIVVELEKPDAVDDGVFVAQGGRFGGYSLYLHRGRVRFTYNYSGLEKTLVESNSIVDLGPHLLQADLTVKPDKSGEVVLRMDQQVIGSGVIPHLALGVISHEPLDFGCDTLTPVSEDYASPNKFAGRLGKITIIVDPDKTVP